MDLNRKRFFLRVSSSRHGVKTQRILTRWDIIGEKKEMQTISPGTGTSQKGLRAG